MNEKMNAHLQEGEKLLWTGTPVLKMLDETHANIYAAKAVVAVAAAIAFLSYYLIGVQNGTIEFKSSVLVILAVLVAVVLAPDWMDVKKLNGAVYAVTDQRLLTLVGGNLHEIALDQIKAYKLDTDKAGQTSVLCGVSGMKCKAYNRRLNTIFGTRMTDDGTACDRFVMYGIPEADKVEALLKKHIR